MAVRAPQSYVLAAGGPGRESVGSVLVTLRRYWWVVVVAVWLALLGAVAATVTTPTTYVGRSSMIVSSNDRAPDQDAVLVQGYVAYFDNIPYQQQLLSEARVDPATTIEAETAAASPILVITASGPDRVQAQANAVAVATAFGNDINDVHSRETTAALATLQDQLDSALARNGRDDQAVIAALQNRIAEVQADQVNVLQELQTQGGVSEQAPSWTTNIGLALVGGLLLGVLAALALAQVSPRLRSSYDVARKVGLETLLELPDPRSPGASNRSEQRARELATVLRARLGGPGVLTVSPITEGGRTAAWLARQLAVEWAAQGFETVLVRLAPRQEEALRPEGVVRSTVNAAEVSRRMRRGPIPGLSVLDTRELNTSEGSGILAARLPELLQIEPLAGAYVVMETSGVNGSSLAQAAVVLADATLLVIEPRLDRAPEGREATEMLRQSGVTLLGAVLGTATEPDRGWYGDAPGQSKGEAVEPGQGSSTSHDGWYWSAGPTTSDEPAVRQLHPSDAATNNSHANGTQSGARTGGA